VQVVMTDGHVCRLANEPTGLNTQTWIPLPGIPGTAAG